MSTTQLPPQARGRQLEGRAAPGAARPSTRPLRHPDALSPHLRRRRAWWLVGLTLVVPGAAQCIAGSRRLGRTGLRVWLGVLTAVVLLVLLALVDRAAFFAVFTRSWTLLVLIGLLVAGALLWAWLFLDAWRLTRPRLLTASMRRAVGATTAVLVVLTSGTMLYGAQQVAAGRNLISGVFGGNARSTAAQGRFNVLLLGGDAGKDRLGLRPDSMTLVSIDEGTGRTVMFSFPRNLENVPFPPGSPMARALPHGFDCGDNCLLNGVYTYAQEHKGLYPPSVRDPGAQATKDAVAALTGLKVNYYVLIDLKGFQHLIDAMGGVRIDVRQRVPIGGGSTRVSGYVEVGNRRLDGYHALWYARSRHGASDYARMARQRCVMTAMLQQMDPQTLLLKFQGIASASTKVVSTDIPEADLATFVDLGLKAKSEKVSSVQFVPPLIRPWRPDLALIRRTVDQAITASESGAAPSRSAPARTARATSTARTGTGTPSRSASSSGAATPGQGAVDAKAQCSAG